METFVYLHIDEMRTQRRDGKGKRKIDEKWT